MKKLETVTLISVTGLRSLANNALKAMVKCCEGIDFAEKKLLCPTDEVLDGIEVIDIPEMDEEGYNRFCLSKLKDYVSTEHCLVVQWDGFVINPHLWDDKFLNYDYIGAAWGHGWENRVGKGGFSLRSQKFLHATSELIEKYNPNEQHKEPQLPPDRPVPEDWFSCVHHFSYMLSKGINFPDPRTALSFSVEWAREEKYYNRLELETYNSFGFHGEQNEAAMEELYGSKARKTIRMEWNK